MIISKNIYGAIVISDIIDGYRAEGQYYFYDSIRDCIDQFCDEFPGADKEDINIIDRDNIKHTDYVDLD